MSEFNPGERAYVPVSRVDGLDSWDFALQQTEILEREANSVKVKLDDGTASDWIGVSLLHKKVGVLIINIGDLSTEEYLMDPLAKSVGQFCKLLIPDDQFRQIRVRSLEELKILWHKEQGIYSHVIWIGHGKSNGIHFAVDGWVGPEKIKRALHVRGGTKKTYISLCCKNGYRDFGGELSRSTMCKNFIGPFHSVDGATASQFCQTFLTKHFLGGSTPKVSFREARNATPGNVSFRLWKGGGLESTTD
ncbi:hypothetical protein [Thiohalorhabdus methylotrophus]|uniref:CHAT domain-containing protein n=1 Tax=Thiohalorhabdus methylotrophus TaxID=3242694 RepID=A0ABV4TUX9_9GAMM